jgi:outer membrane protein insertion porin family
MSRRLRAWVAACLMILGLVASSVAGAQQQGEVIREIRVEGNERIETTTVINYLAVAPGDPFDPGGLDESLRNLFATGLFDDVVLRQVGDALVVTVVENPIINRIAFEGNRRIDDETLQAEIQLQPRVVFTPARVQGAVSRILELYRRSGRFAATVEPQVIELPQNRVDLVFEINEGPITRVHSITFIGNESFSDSTLRGVIQTRETAWYRFLTTDDTYDPDRLAFDEELLRRFYLARGHADFTVVSSIAELTPDGTQFFVTFTVEEGPVYRFGEIDLESRIPALDPGELRALVRTRSGTTYDAELIEDTIEALTERVGELGYAFVEIQPQLRMRRDDLEIDLVYVMDEGPRVFVERIDIMGNVRTLDSVIRREFRLAEGDAYNTVLLRRSRQRIINLGYFESVDVRTVPGSAPDRLVVEVEVAEQSTGELSFGAGFSTADGLLGDVRLTERNLLGRGQEVSARFTLSGRRQEIDLSFTEPWFRERELAVGFDLFSRTTDFQRESSFDERNVGVVLRAGYPLTERLRHSVRYTLREDEIRRVRDDASPFIQDERGKVITSSVGQTFTYDLRDTVFLPSAGYILRLDQDLAGLGGDSRYVRHEVTAAWYYSVTRDVVLNLAGQAGHVFAFAGRDVRLSDRFFVGGETLRGFRFAGIGPRDVDTRDALGGNTYVTGTAEARFPLGLPEELRIFGRTFVDAGTLTNVDVSGASIRDTGNLRAAAGVGLSWLSPIGPIAVDFAAPFLKDDEDRTETVRISFGTRF